MKRTIVAFAAAGLMSLSLVGVASADKGGVPNDNACLGQATSEYAHSGPTSVCEAVRLRAQNDPGPGRSAEVHAFKANPATCP